MRFALIPAGEFTMGTPPMTKSTPEERRHVVNITMPFHLGIVEVTQQEYVWVMGNNPSGFCESGEQKQAVADQETGRFPVENVSWKDATEFCRRLSALPEAQRANHVYRLPTEAEWEWLARKAGRKKTSRFTWGDQYIIPPSSGNLADESTKGTVDLYIPNYDDGYPRIAPVGSFGPDQAGLFDLSGNVSEWVHDLYSLVPPTGRRLELDPFGASFGDSHVVKGSNWRSGSLTELRAAFRDGLKAGRDDLGFRVVRYLYGKNDATN